MTSTSSLEHPVRPRETLPSEPRERRRLELAATFFAVTVLVHNGDHLRRGTGSLGRDVFWGGTVALVVEVGVVALVFARHRWAPAVAAVVGVGLAAGYAVVHFTPARSWVSDSLLSTAHLVSVGAAALEMIAALLLAGVGFDLVRTHGLAPAGEPSPATTRGRTGLVRGVAHPVVLALGIGNAVVLVVSLVQRHG